jgi:hypothetical protein
MTSRTGVGPVLGPPVARPELAVPPHVRVISLAHGDAPEAVVEDWVELEPTLRAHHEALTELVATVMSHRQPGDVAAFLTYADVGDGLTGWAAVLTLELVEAMGGTPAVRARRIVGRLRAAAQQLGHPDGTTQVGSRTTSGRVAAARVRFLAAALPDEVENCARMVEACRWLYPVPRHGDLAWSLCFQTLDLDHADELVTEFDAMAASLRWTRP